MTTFGDLMSLLLVFFVLLLSFSEMDRQKYKQVAGSMEKAFGVQRKTRVMEPPKGMKMIAKDFDQETIATRLEEILGLKIEELMDTHMPEHKDQLEVKSSGNEVTIRMMGESTFDSGKAQIEKRMQPLLVEIGKVLQETQGDIIIAGHTDNVPVTGGPYKTNLKLSIARAASVAEFLLAHSGVAPERISTMGFGEFRPIDSNDTPQGRQKNRRVEIIISTIPFNERNLN
jgi:chemotaxis protein MotB